MVLPFDYSQPIWLAVLATPAGAYDQPVVAGLWADVHDDWTSKYILLGLNSWSTPRHGIDIPSDRHSRPCPHSVATTTGLGGQITAKSRSNEWQTDPFDYRRWYRRL